MRYKEKRVKTHCFLEGWVSLSQDFRGRGRPSRIFLVSRKLGTFCYLKPRLHDTACCQTGWTTRFDNWLNEQLFVQHSIVYTNIQPVVKPCLSNRLYNPVWQPVERHGCQTGCEACLTTGWMSVYTIQPVVKPVWQTVVSCTRGLTVQTAPCYVQSFWHNTGVWQTDGWNCYS